MRLLPLILAILWFTIIYRSVGQPIPHPVLDTSVVPLRFGTLMGKVTDSAGRPIAGATIKVLGTHPLRGAVAKGEGSYCVPMIAPGVYHVQVSAVGFCRDTGSIVVIPQDGTASLDIVLATSHEPPLCTIVHAYRPLSINFASPMKIQSISGEDLGRRARSGLFGTPP